MSSKAKRTADGISATKEDGVSVSVRIRLNLQWYDPDGNLPKDSFVTVQ